MKNKFTLLFSLLTISSFCQNYEMPVMKNYCMEKIYCGYDTTAKNQKAYWDNGNIKVEYFDIANGKKLRKDYFKEGRIKITVEVYQIFVADTNYIENPETGELNIFVLKRYRDVVDGQYIEYHEPTYSKEDIPVTLGQYKNDKQSGKWQTEKGAGGPIVTATYNADGELDGEYIEYYDDPFETKMKKTEWKGQYGILTVTKLMEDFKTNTYVKKTFQESRKVGVWKLFDRDGKVLETVTYD